MNRDFWQSRWDEGRIGFHQGEVNPYLRRHWHSLDISSNAMVFVPLCGKSRDMLWLRDRGHAVIGVEIVPLAVQAFYAENNIPATCRPHGAFILWEGGDIKIYQGDYFNITPDDLVGVGAVYDRASLIALPPSMRQRYADHMHTILPVQRRDILLVTMDYPLNEMEGPPFAVTEQEVTALYQANFEIERVCAEDVLAANPRFREQGLSWLMEKVYVLRGR